jgi:hypothetical protein
MDKSLIITNNNGKQMAVRYHSVRHVTGEIYKFLKQENGSLADNDEQLVASVVEAVAELINHGSYSGAHFSLALVEVGAL